MNNLPDEDPKLLNFLRQNRSIAPPESTELEDRLMSQIDFIPIARAKATHTWWQHIAGGIGIVAVGILGIGIHNLMNPPEPNMAQLQQLNLFLEAHAHALVTPDTSAADRDRLGDSVTDLLLETDIDTDSIDS